MGLLFNLDVEFKRLLSFHNDLVSAHYKLMEKTCNSNVWDIQALYITSNRFFRQTSCAEAMAQQLISCSAAPSADQLPPCMM